VLKIRDRLLVSYGSVLIIAAAGLILGLVSVLGLAEYNERTVRTNVRALDAIAQMRGALRWQQGALLYREGIPQGVVRTQLQNIDQRFRVNLERVDRDFGARNLLAAELLVAIRENYERVHHIALTDSMLRSAELVALFERLVHDCLALYDLSLANIDSSSSARQARSISLLLALLVTATLVVGWLVSLRLARVISEPLEGMSRAASRIAGGDFGARAPSAGIRELDNVALQFNGMVAALRRFQALNIDAIFAEQRRSAAILAAIDDGLIICDQRGQIERINPVALLQLGKGEAECLGRSVAELLGESALQERIRACLDPAEEEYGELHQLVLASGEGGRQRVLDYSLVPFEDSVKRGVVMVLRDTTEQYEFDAIRTEFVLRASHELRTPLTSIRMALGLLEDRLELAPDSRERDLLDTVNEEMQRMLRLLNDLLDLSRMYASSLQFDIAPVSVSDLLGHTVQRFEYAAAAAGVELTQGCEDADLTVAVDRVHIDRVLDNLVSNALRHTPRGGSVGLSCRQRFASVEIAVRDTGEGIAAHQQTRVFEPFVQVGGKTGGAGLGLAMCREIVQQHGGSIALRSVPGKGSLFTLRLPV
jgi:NtrC-family two-component system sensor histidine kinase KinB